MAPPKHLINNNGAIRIRFTYNGVKYNLSKLGSFDDPIAVRYAQSIIDRIALDISNGSFVCNTNDDLIATYNASKSRVPDKSSTSKITSDSKRINKASLFVLEKGGDNMGKVICNHLRAYGKDIITLEDAISFTSWLKEVRGLSNSTISRYVDMLRTVCGLFKEVNIVVENKPNPPAFTKEEVILICNWFKDCTYFKGALYYNYVRFLFLTGCRISEAIGLRWKHVDFNQGVLHFYETLARNNGDSTNRVVKTTKKNIMRHFPINKPLSDLLLGLKQGEPNDLIFTISGRPIEDRNFRSTYWTRCLKECGINYRKPSITRHTFISHFLEKEKDVIKCASLTHGSKHGAQTIFEHYASLINHVEVPDLY